jgi:C-terminal processing protease CtpA/Prc
VEAPPACRLLDVLRRGGDPRPPALGLLFYRVDDEPTLVVAHATGAGAAAGFERGERILAVDGVPLAREAETALVDALRGRTGAAVIAVETSDSRRIERTIALVPERAVLDRRGILVGGALIAATNHTDAHLLLGGPAGGPTLMVHSVAPGSPAESADLQRFDHVTRIDGEEVVDLDTLARRLATDGDGAVTLDILRFAQDEDRFSTYVRVTVPIAEPVWVAFGAAREPVQRAVALAAAP